jgi:prophage regulatory protein
MNSSEQECSNEAIFLRLPAVKALTGLSKSSLYALIRANSFPAPVRLGPRTAAWVRSEIKEWAEGRVLSARSDTSHLNSKRKPQAIPRAA